jgi:DNA (cytosine-5)-methyltransferase 1
MNKVLNLYAGIGGNRKLWEGVEVTAVEHAAQIANVYKELHPQDTVIVADAHKYLADHYREFDFIWSSPPCQSHSRMIKATRHDVARYPDMNLYQEIIFLQNFFSGKWVVENVKPYYEPLIPPTATLGRHYFWANFQIKPFEVQSPKGFINMETVAGAERLKDWLGLRYEGQIYYQDHHSPTQVLNNCVHPDLGLHVFNAAQEKHPQITTLPLFAAMPAAPAGEG